MIYRVIFIHTMTRIEIIVNGKNFGKTWKIGLQNPFSDNSSENISESL